MSEPLDLDELRGALRRFASAREWQRFHSPKNLAMALAAETGELLEVFQWLTDEGSRTLSEEDLVQVREEIADVLIYLVRLADELGIELREAVEAKLRLKKSICFHSYSRRRSRKWLALPVPLPT
jgi:dCTP diphosphatase